MKKRMLSYLHYMDALLEKENATLDYERLSKMHLQQLTFFMHERLIHLLVTLTFAFLTAGTFFVSYLCFHPLLLVLLTALLSLLIPYIGHYFLLENGVQKMYRQYDELLKRKSKCLSDGNTIPI